MQIDSVLQSNIDKNTTRTYYRKALNLIKKAKHKFDAFTHKLYLVGKSDIWFSQKVLFLPKVFCNYNTF